MVGHVSGRGEWKHVLTWGMLAQMLVQQRGERPQKGVWTRRPRAECCTPAPYPRDNLPLRERLIPYQSGPCIRGVWPSPPREARTCSRARQQQR